MGAPGVHRIRMEEVQIAKIAKIAKITKVVKIAKIALHRWAGRSASAVLDDGIRWSGEHEASTL